MSKVIPSKKKKKLMVAFFILIAILLIITLLILYFFPKEQITISGHGNVEYSKLSPFNLDIIILNEESNIILEEKTYTEFSGSDILPLDDGKYLLKYEIGKYSKISSFIIDTTPPLIQLDVPKYVNSKLIILPINISEKSSLQLNDSNGNTIRIYEEMVVNMETLEIPLLEGMNDYILISTDKYNNSSNKKINITLDTKAPQIEITSPTKFVYTQTVTLDYYDQHYIDPTKVTKSVTIKFNAQDIESGINTILVNGEQVKLNNDNKYEYKLKLNGYVGKTCSEYYDTKTATTKLEIQVIDIAGNSNNVEETFTFNQKMGSDCGFGM